jgi:DNA-binding MarR family transcriptional regulator
MSFLLKYTSDHVNFDNGTLDDVCALLRNTEKSKGYFVAHCFPELSEEEQKRLVCANATNDMDYIDFALEHSGIEWKYQRKFMLVLSNYERYIELLINTFSQYYAEVKKLHRSHTKYIKDIIAELEAEKNHALEELLQCFGQKEEKQVVYMFSLLNPVGINFRVEPEYHSFLLGEKFLDTLAKKSGKPRHPMSYGGLARMLCVPVRETIFLMFFKDARLSKKEIIKATGLTEHAVTSILNGFLSERMIVHAEGENNDEIHFMLNADYIRQYNVFSQERENEHIEATNKKRDGLYWKMLEEKE